MWYNNAIDPMGFKSLDWVKGAESLLRQQFNWTYKTKLRETIGVFKLEGKIDVVIDSTELTDEDYKRRSELISEDGTMINKTMDELKAVERVCVIKQWGTLIAAIGVWKNHFQPIQSRIDGIYQRGSLIVDPKYRGIELWSYLIDRINIICANYPMYSISLVDYVANANKASSNTLFTIDEMLSWHNGFANWMEQQRGKNFNYRYEWNEYLWHYVMLNQKLYQILQQDRDYADMALKAQITTPTPDAQLLLYESDIPQDDVILEG